MVECRETECVIIIIYVVIRVILHARAVLSVPCDGGDARGSDGEESVYIGRKRETEKERPCCAERREDIQCLLRCTVVACVECVVEELYAEKERERKEKERKMRLKKRKGDERKEKNENVYNTGIRTYKIN